MRRIPHGAKNYRPPAGPRVESHSFGSIEQAVEYVEQCRLSPPEKFRNSSAGRKWQGDYSPAEMGANLDWYGGTASWKDQLDLVRRGWPEGAARVAKLAGKCEKLVAAVQAKSNAIEFDVAGQWIDIGRHLSGDPECFASVVPSFTAASNDKIIRIECNLSASGGFGSEDYFKRGAVACVIADVVEAAGYRAEIWGVSCHQQYGEQKLQHRILVKQAHDPLDMNRVAMALAHPGFYRRVTWSIDNSFGFWHGLGVCNYDYAALTGQDARDYADPKGRIVVGRMLAGDFGSDFFLKDLASMLRGAGIEVDVDAIFGA